MRTKLLAVVAAVSVGVAAWGAPAGAAPVVATELSATSIKVGATVYIQGAVSPAAGTTRVVVQRNVGGVWSDRDGGGVDQTTGEFKIGLKPSSAGTYLMRVRTGDGSAASEPLTLTVVPARVTISIGLSATRVRVGTLVQVRGVLTPRTASTRVVLQRQVDGRWSDRDSGLVDRTNGAYRVAIRPNRPGTYTLRVRTGGGSVWTRTVTLVVTAPPPAPPSTPPPPPSAPAPSPSPCHPSYQGACVPFASDVDCAGGGGNGPAYVEGPVYVVGPDVYGLDGNDGDGVGCEG